MSGEMSERVARAILPSAWDIEATDAFKAEFQKHAKSRARAAIEAMREPTKEMLESGAGEVWLFDPDVDGPNAKAGDVWRAMIDEAKN